MYVCLCVLDRGAPLELHRLCAQWGGLAWQESPPHTSTSCLTSLCPVSVVNLAQTPLTDHMEHIHVYSANASILYPFPMSQASGLWLFIDQGDRSGFRH